MLNGGGGGQKKRNTKIEPYRHRVETDPKFFDKSWRKLHDAIREIYNHNASGLSFEELYRLTLRARARAPSPEFFCPHVPPLRFCSTPLGHAV
jgi:cullin 3